jgi:methanogenic corrinoid protein MtbC1
MIGGAPVTQNYADEIGADIYAPDGPSAARKAKEALAHKFPSSDIRSAKL